MKNIKMYPKKYIIKIMVMQYTNGYFFVLYYGETLVIVPPPTTMSPS